MADIAELVALRKRIESVKYGKSRPEKSNEAIEIPPTIIRPLPKELKCRKKQSPPEFGLRSLPPTRPIMPEILQGPTMRIPYPMVADSPKEKEESQVESVGFLAIQIKSESETQLPKLIFKDELGQEVHFLNEYLFKPSGSGSPFLRGNFLIYSVESTLKSSFWILLH